jgi:integrase/recombinase XerD
LFGTNGARSDQLLAAYESALAREGKAPATQVKYLHGVRTFLEWWRSTGQDGDVTTMDVDLYLSSWESSWKEQTGGPPSRSTARARIAALKSFFDYLARASTGPFKNPMAGVIAPTVEQKPNDFLRPVEDAALLECEAPAAEHLVVWLLRWTGLRVSEACGLRLQDLDLTPGGESLLVRKSKTTAGVRTIPVVPTLLPELETWLESLRSRGIASPQAYVLATATGGAFKPSFVWRLVKRAGARAGVRPIECGCGSMMKTRHDRGCPQTVSGENVSEITPHTLRRTFGSYLLNKGLRLEVVSRLLGHSSTVVTERAYAELLGSTIRDELLSVLDDQSEAVDRTPPRVA